MDIFEYAKFTKLVKEGSGGGGGSADDRVKYITYMDRGAELIKYPVIEGDTARDPVKKGYIEKPTKEPTASTVYTQDGWSKTDGGAPDSTALQNVTEDRTVYAAFTESVRTYTIRYLDYDGSILKTQQYEYGAMPTYTPEKDGYLFVGWTPEISAVTADIDYTAVWEESVSFAAAGWDKIIEKANDGTAATAWAVGDSKDLTLNYADGTSETVTIKIGAFNEGKMADGTPCKIAFVLSQPLKTLQAWNDTPEIHYRDMTADIYNALTINKYLDEIVFPAMPSELQASIIEREYPIRREGTILVTRKLWGIHDEDILSFNKAVAIPLYTNKIMGHTTASCIMTPRGATTPIEWYLGSSVQNGSYYYASGFDVDGVRKSNNIGQYIVDGDTPRGVVFGFCI